MQKFRWKGLEPGRADDNRRNVYKQPGSRAELLLTYPYVLELKPVFQ